MYTERRRTHNVDTDSTEKQNCIQREKSTQTMSIQTAQRNRNEYTESTQTMLIQIVPSNRNTYRERKNTQCRYRQYRETEMHTEREEHTDNVDTDSTQ